MLQIIILSTSSHSDKDGKTVRRYKLILQNNSQHVAYNVRLMEPVITHRLMFKPSLDNVAAILPAGELVCEVTLIGAAGDLTSSLKEHNAYPECFMRKRFLLSYLSKKGDMFFTEFDMNRAGNQKNVFFKQND
ncbi:MAG: hypothetical protein QM731_08245 [Chitinophagaceae bacterium]